MDQSSCINILLVDQDHSSLQVLENFLLESGWTVVTAITKEQGLDLLATLSPEIILLDTSVADPEEFELVKTLKYIIHTQAAPIILLSSQGDQKQQIKIQAMELGTVDYITKPFDFIDLRTRIQLHLKLSRLHRELQLKNLSLEEKNLENRLFFQACEQSPVSIVITDLYGNITYVNPKFEALSGYSFQEVQGKNPRVLKSGHTSMGEYQALWQSISAGGEWHGEFHNRKKNGEFYWERASISPIRNGQGEITHYVAVKEDITLQKQQETLLLQQANYDVVTGLPNRALVKDRLQQAIEDGSHNNYQVGVLFIDLDNFKKVNDTLGHDAGDKLLQEVAQRLQRCVRNFDTVARLGGDEFLIVATKLKQSMNLAVICKRILNILRQPIVLGSHEIFVHGSIGVTVFPNDGQQVEILLRNADTAMYAAKNAGRNRFKFYTSHMNEAAQRRLALETALRHALARHEINLAYQPLIKLNTGQVVGAEALLRWHHLDFGEVAPTQFIPIAEDTGLIVELGEWVLQQVCQQGAQWQTELPVQWLGINISPRQLRDSYFLDILNEAIKNSGIRPERLGLEITEHILMADQGDILQSIRQLQGAKARLIIDDFGTGFSALSHLRQCQLDMLKIDRSLIQELPEQEQTREWVKAMIAMAHQLKLQVIAEGIETQAQWEFLCQEQCDYGQGFYFCPAIPPQQLTLLWSDQPFQLALAEPRQAPVSPES
ncbi:EAL domain-containing protein [Synechocystis sp. LKSZ1]|uniref:two-component system response regulator n=1 Tax=Synechocystis sp. LKSZ1 TaxID=3144951 RepID=UPI00336C0F53